MNSSLLNLEDFQRDGYQILRGFVEPDLIEELCSNVRVALQPLLAPVEFEADTGYPGAPTSTAAPGGLTPRRLLSAYSRGAIWQHLARHPELAKALHELLGEPVLLSQAHHNCVMTKHPGFSSQTLWHQDIRYWSFERPELISAWFALTEEHLANGGLTVIPGSHTLELGEERFDEPLFLRPEHPDNAALIASAVQLTLEPGDLLLFHCRLFHAAGMNSTDRVKLSAVFTYHGASNAQLPGSRSAMYPSIELADV